jgi:hypothetical protein
MVPKVRDHASSRLLRTGSSSHFFLNIENKFAYRRRLREKIRGSERIYRKNRTSVLSNVNAQQAASA